MIDGSKIFTSWEKIVLSEFAIDVKEKKGPSEFGSYFYCVILGEMFFIL